MITPNQKLQISSVALHYDELDPFYRDIWGEHVHHGLWQRAGEDVQTATRNLIDRVAKQGQVSAGTHVVDVGCGYGGTARVLAASYGAHVTALTISENQFEYARKQSLQGEFNPHYLLCDWLYNELPSQSADVVISIESTEHMLDKLAFFEQAYRVLKPGGRLVICAWLSCEHSRKWEIDSLLEPICREGRLAGLGTESEYRFFMGRTGFNDKDFSDVTVSVHKTWPICLYRTAIALLKNPEYRQYLSQARNENRVFLLTMARIWTAYLTGSMRYGIFLAEKPPVSP